MTTILAIVIIIIVVGIGPSLYYNVALSQLDPVTNTATATRERSGLARDLNDL
jgi:hypothetical protein